MSNQTGYLNRQSFKTALGILGMEDKYSISDRIFTYLDSEKSGFISFSSFIKYIDVIMNGSQVEKLQLAFNMIDYNKKGYFTKSDLTQMIKEIIYSHFSITGIQIT